MSRFLVIPAVISLLRAYFDRRAGRLEKAKARVEAIKTKYPPFFEFLDAFHGSILIHEDDIEGALKFFEKNIRSLPDKKNDNQRYIELYCRYFLDAGKEDFDWKSLISEANQLDAEDFTKRMLILPTIERMMASLKSAPGMSDHPPSIMHDYSAQFSIDGKTMTPLPSRPLPAGTHDANWEATGIDEQRVKGVVSFTVN